MKLANYTALAAAMLLAAGPAWAAETKVPEGTEFPMRIEEALSSKSAMQGDRFTISLTDDVKLPDGTVLKAGYRGVGEVVDAHPSGMLGKSGHINVRLTYLKVGEQQIRLRASKSTQAKGNTTNQIVGVVLIGVFAAVIKGHNTEIASGTAVTAYADDDTTLNTPIEPPPLET